MCAHGCRCEGECSAHLAQLVRDEGVELERRPEAGAHLAKVLHLEQRLLAGVKLHHADRRVEHALARDAHLRGGSWLGCCGSREMRTWGGGRGLAVRVLWLGCCGWSGAVEVLWLGYWATRCRIAAHATRAYRMCMWPGGGRCWTVDEFILAVSAARAPSGAGVGRGETRGENQRRRRCRPLPRGSAGAGARERDRRRCCAGAAVGSRRRRGRGTRR